MNTKTINQKAKAYDMALEAARKELGVDRKEYKVVERVLKSIFPELRESEDEQALRIIKKRMCYDPVPISDEDRRIVENWLEKQKEQKPADIDFRSAVKNVMNLYKIKKDFTEEDYDFHAKELYELVKQKPEWSREDERILTGIIERGSSQIPPYEPALKKEQMEWLMKRLKSLRPQWKPTGEQMSMLRAVLNDPNNAGAESCQLALTDLYEQLKSIY